MSGEWLESRTGKVKLPDDDPNIFRVYIQSLYAGNIRQAESDKSSEARFRNLGQLYVLVDKMMDVHAKDQVVEAI
ncbi:hypothetical protein SLS60_006608 [Paraconiothyrium brasiliense]|uniref:BTB domain-containing protein n=1 Tax=Paraconiothyrium brasiliense TaxID=300254 RepID=A0ABR3RBV4_9PLEO